MGKKQYKKRKLSLSPPAEDLSSAGGNPSEDHPSPSGGNPQNLNSSFSLSPEEYLQLAEEYSSLPSSIPPPNSNLTLPPPISPTPPPPPPPTSPTPPPTLASHSYSSTLKTSLKTPHASSGSRPSTLPKFRAVPAGGSTSYAAVVALENKHPDINIVARPNLKGEIIVTPKTAEAAELLKTTPTFQMLNPDMKLTKAILLHYYATLPLDPVLNLHNVDTAVRLTAKGGIPINKLLVTFKGPVPERLQLNPWGSFPTAKFIPEPLRCFNCNRFGHHKTRCTLPATCGVCSGRHLTEICLTKHKNGIKTTAKCPNCRGAHHAWFKGCQARLDRITPRNTEKINHLPARPKNTPPEPAKMTTRSPNQVTSSKAEPARRTTEAACQTTPVPETPPKQAAATQTKTKPTKKTAEAATQTTPTAETAECATQIEPARTTSRAIQPASYGIPTLQPTEMNYQHFLRMSEPRKEILRNYLLRAHYSNDYDSGPDEIYDDLVEILQYFADLDNTDYRNRPFVPTPLLELVNPNRDYL